MGTLRRGPVSAPEIKRTDVHFERADEQLFLTDVARLLWPTKTAAHVAAVAGCTERAAQFYLAGDRDWSGDAIAAVVAEILRRHKMRNVKIRPR